MDCVPDELILVIDGVIVVQFQTTYGCNIEWFKLCGECSVWESRVVCKKAIARIKLFVPDWI